MERSVLHCDLDNFFASVESVFDPSLKEVPFAVCGDAALRHGIVLAKNQLAKSYGVKTAVPIWEAKQACPNLKIVEPHYDRYMDFSRRARAIYEQYTDMVEAFGADECWLDVTGSSLLFGSGEKIAREINERMFKELGLTVSVGVSFNKCFAKLGSDLNKPNGISVITRENFKEIVWPLPAENLLWIGKSAKQRLNSLGIITIGDIGMIGRDFLVSAFGKSGEGIWSNAVGGDSSPVLRESELPAAKSIGKSVTGSEDLTSDAQVYRTLLALSESISEKLRKCSLLCGTVQLHIRDCMLITVERQVKLSEPTRLARELAAIGMELFRKNWKWHKTVRSVGIRACELMSDSECLQMSFEYDYKKALKLERLEMSVDGIRAKYGKRSVTRASLMCAATENAQKLGSVSTICGD